MLSTVHPHETFRQPPQAIEAEQALLGMLLTNNDLFVRLDDRLSSADFFEPLHAAVYETLSKMIAGGKQATPITLRTFFENAPPVDAHLTVPQYLVRMAVRAPQLADPNAYARAIRDCAMRRQLILLAEDMAVEAYDAHPEHPPAETVERVESRLWQLTERGAATACISIGAAMVVALERANKAYQAGGGLTGLPTGYPDLDAMLGGLEEGDLVILAGRPSMGKTSFACNIATNLATGRGGRAPAPVHFFSLEMSAEQVALRLLAEQSEVPSHKIRKGLIDEKQFARMVSEAQCAADYPIQIDQTGGITVSQLMTRARRMMRQHRTKLIVVDYLQLMRSGRRDGNRTQEITEITNGLKTMAKELGVPVIALSQLSRDVERRPDKRPQLSDLRESGSIEQDADMVIFVYRDEYYLEREKPSEDDFEAYAAWTDKFQNAHGKAEIIIAKNRHGSVGRVELSFRADLTRFSNLARAGV